MKYKILKLLCSMIMALKILNVFPVHLIQQGINIEPAINFNPEDEQKYYNFWRGVFAQMSEQKKQEIGNAIKKDQELWQNMIKRMDTDPVFKANLLAVNPKNKENFEKRIKILQNLKGLLPQPKRPQVKPAARDER